MAIAICSSTSLVDKSSVLGSFQQKLPILIQMHIYCTVVHFAQGSQNILEPASLFFPRPSLHTVLNRLNLNNFLLMIRTKSNVPFYLEDTKSALLAYYRR